MRKFVTVVGLSILTLSPASSHSTASSYAYCMQPSAPTTWLRKPSEPICSSMGRCTDLDVSMYKTDIERYFRSLRTYLAEVDRFREQAYEYAQCMAKLD